MTRVLVVESKECISRNTQALLEDHGYEVSTAGDHCEMQSQLGESEFDVVLLGLALPQHNTVTVLRWMWEHHPNTPTVLLGSQLSHETISAALGDRVFDYLTEPITQEALLKVVHEAAQRRFHATRCNPLTQQNDIRQRDTERPAPTITDTLTQSEPFLRTLIQSAKDMIFVHGFREGNTPDTFTQVNDLACQRLGYTSEEMLTRSPMDIVPQEDVECLIPLAQAAVLDGQASFENTFLSKSGERIPVEINTCIISVEGAPIAFSIARDTTARKEAEEKLRRSEERFRGMFENMTNGVAVYKAVDNGDDFIFVDFNPAAEAIENVDKQDVIGRRLCKAFPGVCECGILEALQRVWRTGEPEHFPACFYADDRVKGWRDNHIYRLSSGEIVAIYRDVTAHKQAEEGLHQYKNIVSNCQDMLALVDRDFIYLAANKTYLTALGKTFDELVGHPAREFFDKETFATVVVPHAKQCLAGEKVYYEAWFEYPTWGRLFMSVAYAPYFDADGEVVGYVVSGRNITERKKAEEALREALIELSALKDQAEAENVYLRKEIHMAHPIQDLVVESEHMKLTMSHAEQVAVTDSTVLIEGETGTGKELLARAIHNMSTRKHGPLVTVNCAAMPTTLMESELFGHEKGAYTGAVARQIGRFEIAHGGTIFLDEIGELPFELQAKLLRVLQEAHIERLGSPDTIPVDVRVIAATNRNLEELVEEGQFRKDIFYRLNVFPITLAPLRERREDILPLVRTFTDELATKMGKQIDHISQSSQNALLAYSWPGNVRELRNVIERAMITTTGTTLEIPPLQQTLGGPQGDRSLADMERTHIMNILEETGGRVRGKGGAAEILSINPSTLESRMKKLGIARKA